MSNSFIQLPADSTGKKLATEQHTIGANDVQVQVVHIADESVPTNRLSIDEKGSASVRFAEGQPVVSGFGSLKIANQRALGVYESSQDTYDDLFTVQTVSGGASTYDSTASSVVLSTNTTINSKCVRTTNRYHYYLPGSSNLWMQTIALGDSGKVGNIRRWGAYDDSDGLFFQLAGTTIQVGIRSSTTGSVTDTVVSQSQWNGDKVDGTGLSGYNLSTNITDVNIYWSDYQWLGAGRVRFGVYTPEGARVVCHTFENAGANPRPYMRTGTLPLRTENANTAVTASSSEMREVCMAIYTEGTYEDYTFWRKADIERTSAAVSGQNIQIVSMRAKTLIAGKHNAVQSYPETLNVYTTQPVAITLWQNTEVVGGTWDIVTDSALDGNTTGTVDTTNAVKFKTFYFDSGAHIQCLTNFFELNDEGIMALPNGTSEVWSFTATNLTGTPATVTLNLCHKELW